MHKPIKKLGQNFLKDKKIIKKIINFINPKYKDKIIEIGPGLGALTIPISKISKSITAIEIDKNLVYFLNKNKNIKNNLNIINIDIMKLNLKKFFSSFCDPVRIFGSLPYNISVSLMFNFIENYNKIIDMHFVIQKEVAQRILARPNNKHYGYISVIMQYYFYVEKLIDISNCAFKPIPKVQSSLIRMRPHKVCPFPFCDIDKMKVLLKSAFNQRRKMLKNSLKKYFSVEQIILYKINPKLRAENLSIENYCNLSNNMIIKK
ncbi:ksgA [Wigglesworthia glossinidia endosymbiont of Glossina brevipalpis]|uniref:Ribosomal RNA small subunit methyltransferase A n=1 Tax=Wigglesworthia glossinidia brevipalpis TaxID=36870 RepID=RSMA_WIGBR|nr:RecName: Full=Ribosomal RNA small subunit methyltransferase A; AltName: Full=16S rRNA (adenine(1518)-N(6)/adenine(1519)-N(6))-dimethyltransferase; AltName: Full=16S rRNA dimethyladenosine transferase; AltName: Full=16S rRNA dimethylase; AltName: Full=S-adenosylmethionine-6-N', N'-adenosyl(rRNA) dimethyltransferase [Wigglesworthia glossinidia endosymbiont of Glossina brevipalpis]BAC24166.1 ksgA [Wigglesworthia glossinidia endosymbiont of Glossina brevipalpis]